MNEAGRNSPSRIDRRLFLKGALASGVGMAAGLYWHWSSSWPQSPVAIVKATNYDQSLANIIGDGLSELGIGRELVRNKCVLLKPNLVEPSIAAPHINTHPQMVLAAIEVFRRLDAREVIVAEGQGHCRDTHLVLEQSGFRDIMRESNTEFIDLNHDELFEADNRLNTTKMKSLMLPETLKRADLIVSMPKLKTHHWAGATLSMKNFFRVMPGICYGWPKNVLHHNGIPQSIVDITATVQPHLAIVDGVIGMEGDGPIMGDPCDSNVIIMGAHLPAVDATAIRVMGLDPHKMPFMQLAAIHSGVIRNRQIQQRGELIAEVQRTFRLLDHPLMSRFG